MAGRPKPIRIYQPLSESGSIITRQHFKWFAGVIAIALAASTIVIWIGQHEPRKEIQELKNEVNQLKASMAFLEERLGSVSRDLSRKLGETETRDRGGAERRGSRSPQRSGINP